MTHTDRKLMTLASLLFLFVSHILTFHFERLKGHIIQVRETTYLQVRWLLKCLHRFSYPHLMCHFAFSPTLALPGLLISFPSNMFFLAASLSAPSPPLSHSYCSLSRHTGPASFPARCPCSADDSSSLHLYPLPPPLHSPELSHTEP